MNMLIIKKKNYNNQKNYLIKKNFIRIVLKLNRNLNFFVMFYKILT